LGVASTAPYQIISIIVQFVAPLYLLFIANLAPVAIVSASGYQMFNHMVWVQNPNSPDSAYLPYWFMGEANNT